MSENEMQFEPTEQVQEAPVFEETPVAASKKSGKKGLIIGAAILAVVIILAAIVIGVMNSSPLGLIATGFKNSMEALAAGSANSLLNQTDHGGSVEISLDLGTLTAGTETPLDGTGALKIYMDAESQKSVINLSVQLAQLQPLTANLYLDQNSIALSSQEFLGDKAYGINLQSFVEDFNKSIFRIDGPYSLGIELPEDLQLQVPDSQKFAEATGKIAGKMAPKLLTIFEKNSTAEKENATLTLGGDEVKTTAVTIHMDHTQLTAFAAEFIDYLRTDEAFKQYLEENKDYIFQTYGMNGEFDDANALIDDFYQELEHAAQTVKESAKELEESNASLAVTFHITKSGKQLIGMELSAVDGEETLELCFYAGPDLKEAKEVRFYVNEFGDSSEATYTVKVNDENTFVSLLDLSENGEKVMTADLRWDKQTGKIELVATDDWEDTFSIQGNWKESDKEATFLLESVTAGGVKTDLGITVVLRTDDKMPDAPQFTELLKLTEGEMDSLMEDLGAVILQILIGTM